MKKSILDLIKLILPISPQKKEVLSIVQGHVGKNELADLKYFLKMDKLFGRVYSYNTSTQTLPELQWVEFKTHVGDEDVKEFIARVNEKVQTSIDEMAYKQFSAYAHRRVPELIANNIVGAEKEKFAGALLLFAKEPFHLLFLGDPGTGKTDILRSVAALAPKSAFGLGSGTSGVGLSAMYKGDELILGLLPQADQGIACVDELNLMKTQDQAALYNAMEKGFVTYDKGGKHIQLDARVRVGATANPKGDEFVGEGAAILKKQLPFGHALLSRFHLVLLLRKPNAKELGTIARKIIEGKAQIKKGDAEFVKKYITWTWKQEIEFPKKFEQIIVEFIEKLHGDQKKFLVEIGPRTIVGIIRMTKAYARMQGKDCVSREDLERILTLVKDIYYVRKE